MNKGRRAGFFIIILVSFATILIYNMLTPYMSDELYHQPGVWRGLGELLKETADIYMTWNGRAIPQFIMTVCTAMPKPLFNILNSIMFVVLTLLIYLNIDNRDTYDCRLLLFITLFLWTWGIAFDQTMLWLSGACNYLWPGCIVLGCITVFRRSLLQDIDRDRGRRAVLCILLFLLGIMGGWCNENTSGGAILLLLFFTCRYCVEGRRKPKPEMLSLILGMGIGLVALVASPGVRLRMDINVSGESSAGLMALLGRLLKLNRYVSEDLSVLGIALAFIIGWLIAERYWSRTVTTAAAFVITGIITIYVLIAIPTPMDRALLGAQLFIFIGLCMLLPEIEKQFSHMNIVYNGVVIMLLFNMLIVYTDCAANLYRIQRELREREEYVAEEKAKGNDRLRLPELSREWDNKYTFIYHENDISTEGEEIYGNKIYKVYYDLEEIIPVSREQWNTRTDR